MSMRSAPEPTSGAMISAGSRLKPMPASVNDLLMNRLVHVLRRNGARPALANHAVIVSNSTDCDGCTMIGKLKIATPAALAKLPIIVHPSPSLLFETITAWFASAGLAPFCLNTCTSLFISKSLTLEGIGLSLLPAEIIAPEVGSGALRMLKARPLIPPVPLYVSYRRAAPPASVNIFIERIRASVKIPGPDDDAPVGASR